MDAYPEKNKFSVDFTIVGGGLAGSILAMKLIKAGYKICLIDKAELSSSSKVAAGIWNPVVFKRLTKSWKADELVPSLMDFYTEFENENKVKVIQNRTIIKPFSEVQETTLWLNKSFTENTFLDKNIYQNLVLNSELTIPDYSKVLKAGNLDVDIFLKTAMRFIETHARLEREVFDYSQLQKDTFGISYKNLHSKAIIFSEGYLVSKNPFFSWIPMKPAKGEVLTIRCENLKLENDILNKGIFILPLEDHVFKVGATYQWNELNDTPTNKAKEALSQKLSSLIKVPFQILKHEAGVRPSVSDRRPLIGQHPEHKNYWIFNGFGTKGVMLIPYFASYFLKCLKGEVEIDPEVNAARFFKE